MAIVRVIVVEHSPMLLTMKARFNINDESISHIYSFECYHTLTSSLFLHCQHFALVVDHARAHAHRVRVVRRQRVCLTFRHPVSQHQVALFRVVHFKPQRERSWKQRGRFYGQLDAAIASENKYSPSTRTKSNHQLT